MRRKTKVKEEDLKIVVITVYSKQIKQTKKILNKKWILQKIYTEGFNSHITMESLDVPVVM